MKSSSVCYCALILTFATTAAAQTPGANPLPNMQEIARALGVECEYCHAAARGSGQPEPKKDVARAMMAMTRDLNMKIQAATGKPAGEAAAVQCITCHRGVAIPRQLPEILSQTLKQKDAAAAAEQYRELRKQYYGRQAYDFSEDTLLALAQQIVSGRPDDAIALLQVNLEYYPRSARSYAAIGYAYTRKYDDASAIASLEKALEIEPENGVIQGQLEQLKSYRRRK